MCIYFPFGFHFAPACVCSFSPFKPIGYFLALIVLCLWCASQSAAGCVRRKHEKSCWFIMFFLMFFPLYFVAFPNLKDLFAQLFHATATFFEQTKETAPQSSQFTEAGDGVYAYWGEAMNFPLSEDFWKEAKFKAALTTIKHFHILSFFFNHGFVLFTSWFCLAPGDRKGLRQTRAAGPLPWRFPHRPGGAEPGRGCLERRASTGGAQKATVCHSDIRHHE